MSEKLQQKDEHTPTGHLITAVSLSSASLFSELETVNSVDVCVLLTRFSGCCMSNGKQNNAAH